MRLFQFKGTSESLAVTTYPVGVGTEERPSPRGQMHVELRELILICLTSDNLDPGERDINDNSKQIGFGLVIKLLIAPLVVLWGCRLLGLSGLSVNVSIMEAGMPPMVTAAEMAVIAGMESELAVALVGVGIVLSFGTLPFLYMMM